MRWMKRRDPRLHPFLTSSLVVYLGATHGFLVVRIVGVFLSILMLPISLSGTAKGETFSNPGYYTVIADGWTRSGSPNAFSYQCIACKEQVEIKIEYGPPLSAIAP